MSQNIIELPVSDEVKNFVTILHFGKSTASLRRSADPIAFIKELMELHGFRPATEIETREILEKHFHPSGDVVCIEGDSDPLVAFRKTPATGISFKEIRIPRKDVRGFQQWFPVKRLS